MTNKPEDDKPQTTEERQPAPAIKSAKRSTRPRSADKRFPIPSPPARWS